MAEYLGFLKDICAHPDDDDIRLIYADWLEDNGQPERAEFIRVQCELHRLPADDPSRQQLERREAELLAAYRDTWLNCLPDFCGVYWRPYFHRGFVEGVEAGTWSAFESQAAAIFAAGPVQHLLVRQLNRPLKEILSSPHLLHLTHLDIRHQVLYYEAASSLAQSSYLARCKRLTLVRTGTSVYGIARLIDSVHLDAMTALHLSFTRIGDVGVSTLVKMPRVARLTSLKLHGTSICDRGAAALANSPHLSQLTDLYLADNYIGTRGAWARAESPHLAGVRHLDLRLNRIPTIEKRRLGRRFGDRLVLT
jgi:uncharacterized protein (TIGR02996 family)